MFTTPSRRAFLTCSSNTPTTSRRLISTATTNTLQPAARRYSSSSSSSNSKPFGPNNRGLASKGGAFRKRTQDGRTSTQVVAAPPIPGAKVPAAVAEVEVEEVQQPKVMAQQPSSSTGTRQQKTKPQLPFVARTDHMNKEDVRVSSFFALHRPVSVNYPVPGSYTNTAFDRLFDKLNIVSTLEMYKDQLETQARQAAGDKTNGNPANSTEISLTPEEILSYANKALAAATPAERKLISESPLPLPSHVLSADFQPFKPPPPPKPMSDKNLADAMNPPLPQRIQISVVSNGKLEYTFTHEFEEAESENGGFVPVKGDRVRRRAVMNALSVKRQRKLKMKKHKYKKLMKKTRTLRRKLEKQ